MEREEGQAILVNLHILYLATLRALCDQLKNTDHGGRDRLVGVRLEQRRRMSRAVDGTLAGDFCALLANARRSIARQTQALTILISRVGGLHARDLLHVFLHVLCHSSASASKLEVKCIRTHINEVIQPRGGLQAALILQIGGEHFTESIVVIRIKDIEDLFLLALTKLKGVQNLPWR